MSDPTNILYYEICTWSLVGRSHASHEIVVLAVGELFVVLFELEEFVETELVVVVVFFEELE